MGNSLKEQFRDWLCQKFGHVEGSAPWTFKGGTFSTCKRCGRVYRAPDLPEKIDEETALLAGQLVVLLLLVVALLVVWALL